MANTTAITCDYCGQIIHQRDPGYRAVFSLRALRGEDVVQRYEYDVHFRERCLRGILRGLAGTVKVMLGKALPESEPETANKKEGE